MYRLFRWIHDTYGAIKEELTRDIGKNGVEVILTAPAGMLWHEWWRATVGSHAWLGWAILATSLFALLFGIYRRNRLRGHRQSAVRTFVEHLHSIHGMAERLMASRDRKGHVDAGELRHTIEVLLQAMCELTRELLGISKHVGVHANLMVRMPVYLEGIKQRWDGCGVVAYNQSRPPNPSWTRVAIPDFGAGEAFDLGSVQVIEDTRDPYWCGVFDRTRAESFVSLPVMAPGNSIIAVVNIDSTRRRTFKRKVVEDKLHPALFLALELLSKILCSTQGNFQGGTHV